jgi:hypothetical protein
MSRAEGDRRGRDKNGGQLPAPSLHSQSCAAALQILTPSSPALGQGCSLHVSCVETEAQGPELLAQVHAAGRKAKYACVWCSVSSIPLQGVGTGEGRNGVSLVLHPSLAGAQWSVPSVKRACIGLQPFEVRRK